MTPGLTILTHSRMQARKACSERHYVSYTLGIRRDLTEQPLRMGQAVHHGLDVLHKTGSADEAMMAVDENYAVLPDYIDDFDWRLEHETCRRMLWGYVWRWGDEEAELVASELSFNLPIVNPATGRAGQYRFAGKIDKIVRVGGVWKVREHKTTGVSIAADADYWRKLRIDTQISGYYLAAHALGFPVESVEYDVLRKPGIEPKKIVNADRKAWRETGRYFGEEFAYDDGVERETVRMWGARFAQAMTEAPDEYFARRDIPRLESDIDQFKQELWSIAHSMHEEYREGWHFRNSDACLTPFPCPYREPCWNGWDFASGLPQGFVAVDNIHPELGEKDYANCAPTP